VPVRSEQIGFVLFHRTCPLPLSSSLNPKRA
jgi:hypothetical protein